jgi:hypothetical protein
MTAVTTSGNVGLVRPTEGEPMATKTLKTKLMAAFAAGTLAMFGAAACEVDEEAGDDPLMDEEPAEDPFEDDAEGDLDDGGEEDDL